MSDINDTHFIISKENVLKLRRPTALAIYLYYETCKNSKLYVTHQMVKDQFKISQVEYEESLHYLHDMGIS